MVYFHHDLIVICGFNNAQSLLFVVCIFMQTFMIPGTSFMSLLIYEEKKIEPVQFGNELSMVRFGLKIMNIHGTIVTVWLWTNHSSVFVSCSTFRFSFLLN